MATYKKKVDLFETEAGQEIKRLLYAMSRDIMYSTDASYSADSDLYPDHQIPFVNKHMAYLRSHPGTDPQQYIANLRLITKKRS